MPHSNTSPVVISGVSSVLSLQGGRIVEQPCFPDKASSQSFLMWNGEVFGGEACPPGGGSDTIAVAHHFFALEKEASTAPVFLHRVARFLETQVEGPYGFVYYASSLCFFAFGRDPIGRRSLLVHYTPQESELLISSVGMQSHHELQKRQPLVSHSVEGRKRGRGADDEEDEGDDDSPEDEATCWIELPVTGIFGYKADRLQSDATAGPLQLLLSPWAQKEHLINPLLRTLPASSATSGFPALPSWCTPLLTGKVSQLHHLALMSQSLTERLVYQTAQQYLLALAASVYRRIQPSTRGVDPTRPVGVLFSGGLDCAVLAALAHYLLPVSTPIELINVVFGKDKKARQHAPDRISAFRVLHDLLQLPADSTCQQSREWRMVLVDVEEKHSAEVKSHILHLLAPLNSVMDLDIGSALWYASRGVGRMQRLCHGGRGKAFDDALPAFPMKGLFPMESPAGVCEDLFPLSPPPLKTISSHEAADQEEEEASASKKPFELLRRILITECYRSGNGPDKAVLLSTLGKDYGLVLQPHLRLHQYRKLGPFLDLASKLRLICFDPTASKSAKGVMLTLPEDLEAAALAAASSGVGEWCPVAGASPHALPSEGTYELEYCCQARILLLGIGSDETLGGYMRHRRSFERGGIQGALNEIQRDFQRLWQRNLGRDDRIVTDHGREARLPYLDEALMGAIHHIAESNRRVLGELGSSNTLMESDLAEQSVDPLICYGLPPGVGDKRVLRHVALTLGVVSAARLEKRAIQFGSRIADPKIRGSASLAGEQ